ncbi:hypothetical protein [Rhodoplanes sp. Z2-YC6860]|uniref:hypothetical protein n=1 Tax=Rhodoplanes sp. Z2-YC6860 TaxID=674703 RepID=UPI00083058E0|nr:hypothetical protein [Rhodoplanes sp. Z2-YC6860]
MRSAASNVLLAVIAGAVVLAFMDPASAARRKRVYSETGPLIMSGSFGAMASYRRPHSAEICKPVTVRVR